MEISFWFVHTRALNIQAFTSLSVAATRARYTYTHLYIICTFCTSANIAQPQTFLWVFRFLFLPPTLF